MKNNYKIIIAIVASLTLGFLIAWFSKPSNSQAMVSSDTEDHSTHEHEMSGAEMEYTCSMHPQIRQKEPGICPICEMDLIPVDQNVSDDPLVLTMTKEAAKLSNIQTSIVGSSNNAGSAKQISMTGKVKTNETSASSLVAHVPGRIEKLYVSYTGEKVKEGQKLADIYSSELISAQQELLEAKSLSNVNPNLLEAAKGKLRNWKLTESIIDGILESERVQETFTFFAESSGTVSNRSVAVGDYVNKGEALFDLIDLDKVWVIFDAYEEDLSSIKVGDRIEFTAPAMGSRKFNTRVSFIDPVINADTRTGSIRTEVGNKSGALKPEMFVNGVHTKIKSGTGSSLLVPKSAILWTGTRSVVYVKEQDMDIPSFRYIEIILGERIGDYYKVESGLEAGAEVVTNGAFTIDAAAQLNNQVSMMNKNVSLKSSKNVNTIPDYTDITPQAFKSQIGILVDQYMDLKEALVSADPVAGKTASKIILNNIDNIDMTLVEGEAHMYWMEKLNGIKAHGKKLNEVEDVEDQRKQFEFLSEQMIETVMAFGIPDKTVYVQYCPMAFDNRGADWLSYEEQIKNPYFGDKMMKCGSVTDTLAFFQD
jgi:Cu(I)/Ag(I) efflux system membrane fusion protein